MDHSHIFITRVSLKMVLIHTRYSNKSNTSASDATSGGHLTTDPASVAVNIEMEADTGNQVPPSASPIPAEVVVDIESMQNVIQMLTTLVEA
ncbi:hypothetical protein HAX54_029980 [Datura stramonium]|uniref:Uncharacterized protein n=1 Tax=Datura stramonium TaxID=4076 RepID=A0ABS8SAM4_DATST|nr:hypothetical protein [Datura stramonium]